MTVVRIRGLKRFCHQKSWHLVLVPSEELGAHRTAA